MKTHKQKNLQITDGRDKPNKDLFVSYFPQVLPRDLAYQQENDSTSNYSNSGDNNDNNNYINMIGQCRLNFQISVKLND